MANKKQTNGLTLPRSAYSSPYMKNYIAARTGEKSGNKPVKMMQVPRSNPNAFQNFGPGAGYGDYAGYDADFGMGYEAGYKEPASAKPKRARRFVPVLFIVIFTLLYIAVLGLSYLNMDALSDYNQYFALYEGNPDSEYVFEDNDVIENGDTDGEDADKAEAAEAESEDADKADENADEDAVDTETGSEDIAAPETVKVGVEDLLMSFVAVFVDSVDGSEYYMYNEFYQDIDSADTVTMIASYAMPVLLILAAVTALIFLIRSIVTLFTSKRRKLFILSAVLMLVFTLLSAVCAYLMFAGTDFSAITGFLTMDGTLPLQLGIGNIILAALSLVTLIFSFFAFRKGKKLS